MWGMAALLPQPIIHLSEPHPSTPRDEHHPYNAPFGRLMKHFA